MRSTYHCSEFVLSFCDLTKIARSILNKEGDVHIWGEIDNLVQISGGATKHVASVEIMRVENVFTHPA